MLNPFQPEHRHVTSDVPGQDAGHRVHHLHPDCIAHRRLEHHAKHGVWLFPRPSLQQHLFILSRHLPATRNAQLQRCQLFRLRPEVVQVSPGTGNICMFQVFEAQKGRTEERGCDCEHKDDRSVGCVQLRNTVRKNRPVLKETCSSSENAWREQT